MPNDATNSRGSSQFEPLTFDSSAAPGAASCKLCGTPLRGSYHMVNDNITCAKCRFAAEERLQGGTSAAGLVRAIAFGLGAAIVGAAAYYAFTKATGIEWALLTGLVGLGVGKAVNIGGNGHGGRKFQVVALALTWFAMAGAYMPFMLEGAGSGAEKARVKISAQAQATVDSIRQANGADAPLDSATLAALARAQDRATRAKNFKLPLSVALIAIVAGLFTAPILVAIASPISGLFIGYALYRAWKFNRGGEQISVGGPFRLQSAPGTPPAA
jgi:hypothetical protein